MERPSNAGIKPEQVLILDPKSELRFCGKIIAIHQSICHSFL